MAIPFRIWVPFALSECMSMSFFALRVSYLVSLPIVIHKAVLPDLRVVAPMKKEGYCLA